MGLVRITDSKLVWSYPQLISILMCSFRDHIHQSQQSSERKQRFQYFITSFEHLNKPFQFIFLFKLQQHSTCLAAYQNNNSVQNWIEYNYETTSISNSFLFSTTIKDDSIDDGYSLLKRVVSNLQIWVWISTIYRSLATNLKRNYFTFKLNP